VTGAGSAGGGTGRAGGPRPNRPNLLFILADQWRAQATGYAGDPNARTPHVDRLRDESVSCTTAVSTTSVCCPARASLLTGQYPLTHGLFMNDVPLGNGAVSIAQAFAAQGYDTGYIGKWHVDGHGWEGFIPPQRRQGFRFWRALECTHDYHHSRYYSDEDDSAAAAGAPVLRTWEGYDAAAQTRCAEAFIREHAGAGRPFFLMLAWGPPHGPYHTAPEQFRARFDPARIELRPNVPAAHAGRARADLAGYCAHIAALDACLGDLLRTLGGCGIAGQTVVVFTSDHGDHLWSHGLGGKQTPWDESIRVPLLVRLPRALGAGPREVDVPLATADIMPTLLGLCGVPVPPTVQGTDRSAAVAGREAPETAPGALVACYFVHGAFRKMGGRHYRGIRTRRHTYVRDLRGPWLLYDNLEDPYQLDNLCGRPEHRALQAELDRHLQELLDARGDEFLPGEAYVERWGYAVDPATGYALGSGMLQPAPFETSGRAPGGAPDGSQGGRP
jgi:arylsulfatase A-like enzyme